jgi:hypothetical protein
LSDQLALLGVEQLLLLLVGVRAVASWTFFEIVGPVRPVRSTRLLLNNQATDRLVMIF